MFKFATPEIKEQYYNLIRETDGSEPCRDNDRFSGIGSGRFLGESDTDLFVENYVGDKPGHSQPEGYAEALCGGCHVYDQCRAYALAAKEKYGIWGGTTPRQRKEMNKQ